MSRDPGEHFAHAVAILVAGMLVPPAVAAMAGDPAALPVTGKELFLLAALGFGLVSTGLIVGFELDRVNFLLVSIAIPWPVLFAGLFAFLLANMGQQVATGPEATVFLFLVPGVGDFLGYGAAFSLAGAGAVGVSRSVDDVSIPA